MNTNEQYTLLIDHDYINGLSEFNNIFEEPIDILGFFMHQFANVLVEDESIKIKYEFGTIRRIAKYFTFKLKKVEIDPL
jgi:hypothetical protein